MSTTAIMAIMSIVISTIATISIIANTIRYWKNSKKIDEANKRLLENREELESLIKRIEMLDDDPSEK